MCGLTHFRILQIRDAFSAEEAFRHDLVRSLRCRTLAGATHDGANVARVFKHLYFSANSDAIGARALTRPAMAARRII